MSNDTNAAVEMVNPAMKVTINGRTLIYKRLPISDILTGLKILVRQEYTDDSLLFAESIKDQKAKDRYIIQATKAIPKGKELDDLVEEKGKTAEGNLHISYLIFSNSNNITKQELEEIAKKNIVEFYDKTAMVQQYAFALDLAKEESEEKSEEKKTPVVETETKETKETVKKEVPIATQTA